MEFSNNASELSSQLRGLTKGRIFRVTFNKRTTGEERTMVCRFGVKKGITGTGQKFEPEDRGLLTVFDVQKNGFRMIPLEGIKEFKIAGTVYNYRRE